MDRINSFPFLPNKEFFDGEVIGVNGEVVTHKVDDDKLTCDISYKIVTIKKIHVFN